MKKWNINDGCSIYKVLDGFYNAYLLVDRGEFHLIDTGRKNQTAALQKNLSKITGGQAIRSLILTHTHYDHCGSAAIIKESYGAKIIVGEKEAGYLKEGSTPLPEGTNFFTRALSKSGNRYATSWFKYKPVVPEIEIIDTLMINENIKIITTPGHSKGSISVIVDNQYAIVGDAMIGSFRGNHFPQFADDRARVYETWKDLLMHTDCHTFLPGHGRPISRQSLEKEVARI